MYDLSCDRVGIICAKRGWVIKMNRLKISICVSLFIPLLSLAATPQIEQEQLKPLSDVRISMQRMLKSTDGRYFLDLYAGIWNPHGTLIDLQNPKRISLKGTQKGDQLNLQSIAVQADPSVNGSYQLTGLLNVNTGAFKATLAEQGASGTNLQFEPAFKAADKPVLMFKFYGLQGPDQPYGRSLKRVDVINKNNGQVMQSLEGFSAFGNSIGFLDVNFDGYYDVVLSDTSEDQKIEDKRFVYWMYNSKTQKFQRAPQLEKIAGFPTLKGELQQIDFGQGQIYKVDQGLLYPVKQE